MIQHEFRKMNPYCVPGVRQTEPITPEKIIRVTCQFFKISEKQLKELKDREFAFPRFLAMNLICYETNLSLKKTAKLFNKKNHTTVINARDTIDGFIDIKDGVTLEALEELKQLIKQ